MPHCVVSVVNAVFQSLIAHVNGIVSALGDDGFPYYLALSLHVVGGGYHTSRTLVEWVLVVGIHTWMHSKSDSVAFLPLVMSVGLAVSTLGRIVVNNILVPLPVSLAWRKYHSTSVLQHWNQVRRYYGLRKQVFACSKQRWSLPLPCAVFHVEVSSVTCPQRYVPVLQSLSYLVGYRCVLYPWTSVIINMPPSAGFVLRLPQSVWHQLSQVPSVSGNLQVVFLQRIRQQFAHLLIDSLRHVIVEQLLA